MKIEIKNTKGEVIYSHEEENNTLRKTLEKAVSKLAYLRGADLQGADLQGADLPIYSKWNVSYSLKEKTITIKIGCKEKNIKDWDTFFYESNEKYSTDIDSEDFKRITANYEAVKAYVKIMYPNNL